MTIVSTSETFVSPEDHHSMQEQEEVRREGVRSTGVQCSFTIRQSPREEMEIFSTI